MQSLAKNDNNIFKLDSIFNPVSNKENLSFELNNNLVSNNDKKLLLINNLSLWVYLLLEYLWIGIILIIGL